MWPSPSNWNRRCSRHSTTPSFGSDTWCPAGSDWWRRTDRRCLTTACRGARTGGGHEIGALVGGTVASPELLAELADASALLVEIVRLRIELRQALSEVESSRARLLHAGYEERRRLERDLHDGAQQRLVSLGMALRLAQRHLDDPELDVDGLLDASVAELATAVAELRQIAHGLRPSSLDDGLGQALSSLASKVPIPVTVDVAGEVGAGRIPDDVATTAFFVASEAMANAVKHAHPAMIGLRVTRDDERLTVQVRDDGQGGASVRPGAGLAGLADRVAAAGGALSLSVRRAGERSWRRFCRAHRDRRGFGAVPRGAGAAARGRGS